MTPDQITRAAVANLTESDADFIRGLVGKASRVSPELARDVADAFAERMAFCMESSDVPIRDARTIALEESRAVYERGKS
jgi:hypothetical protein